MPKRPAAAAAAKVAKVARTAAPTTELSFTATAKPGGARNSSNKLIFEDAPDYFLPTLTPKQLFQSGAMGGSYFRKIESHITKETHEGAWKEFE